MRSRSYGVRMRAPAILLATLLAATQPVRADTVDVLVQAGHEGRPQSCSAIPEHTCNLGTGFGSQRERAWTAEVANVTARALRAAGMSVRRRPADYHAHDVARAAVFLHFDGSAPACRSGASVGFPTIADAPFARRWQRFYRSLFPFAFAGENITPNEARYYDYRNVDAPRRRLLIEFGEMTCPAQERWLAPRLPLLGHALARFLIAELGA